MTLFHSYLMNLNFQIGFRYFSVLQPNYPDMVTFYSVMFLLPAGIILLAIFLSKRSEN